MSKDNLTLVHDSSSNSQIDQSREKWGFENAKQLKLFGDTDRDYLILIGMSQMNMFSFSKLLEAENPASIIDTRKYPDFFGLFNSTKIALESFRKAEINYVHAPVSWVALKETEKSWNIRSSLIEELSRAKGVSEFHGRSFLLLISTDEMKAVCSSAFRTLPDFEQDWQIQTL